MNKSTIIIAIIILGLAYYYWKKSVKTQPTDNPDPTELTNQKKDKKELSDNFGNLLPQTEKPILSHKKSRQLKKGKK